MNGYTEFHGHSGTHEHRAWRAMKQRAGTELHPRWQRFVNFLADMGTVTPEARSLVRLDYRKPYGPKNCRWGTRKEVRALRRPPANPHYGRKGSRVCAL